MKAKSNIIRWSVLFLIGLWGCLSFVVLAGDENPTNPTTLGLFVLLKGAAAISLYLCYLTGRSLYRKGYIPEIGDDK